MLLFPSDIKYIYLLVSVKHVIVDSNFNPHFAYLFIFFFCSILKKLTITILIMRIKLYILWAILIAYNIIIISCQNESSIKNDVITPAEIPLDPISGVDGSRDTSKMKISFGFSCIFFKFFLFCSIFNRDTHRKY